MARHKTRIFEEDDETPLDISSLIDICFLVLIYFIVAMTIIPEEHDLGMSLPTTERSENQKSPIPPMFIRIDAQGMVFSGNGMGENVLDSDPDSRDLPQLLSQLELYSAAAKSAGDTPSVMLRLDENVRQQRVIDVLNAFAAAEISMVAIDDLVNL